MENKKTLILSIIGILVLVIAVVGVSFAMYSFTGEGTQTNLIQTGSISIAVENGNGFTFNKAYAMTDERGIQEGISSEVSVSGTWTATTPLTINYDLGIEVTYQPEGATLTEKYIKIALLDNTGRVVVGSVAGTDDLTGGVTIESLKNTQTTNKYLDGYALTKGVLTSSGKPDTYRIIGWVDESYTLAVDPTKSTTDNGGDGSVDKAGFHKKETASETFKFKLVVEAHQV